MDNGSVCDKLFHAAEFGIQCDVVELISKGVDVNVRDKSGRTPLIVALVHWHPETAIFLIDNGANLNLADREGYTPLMLAMQTMNLKVCKMLINKGCNLTQQNDYNETALHIVVKTCESTISQYIDRNSENPYNDPRIQEAINRTLELLKLLISTGCDVNIRNKNNQIALHLTSRMPECAKYLLQHGSNVNIIDTFERTPLTVAIDNTSIEVIEVLLNHGINPNLGRSLTFDLWFYPLDPLQFKILTLLLKFQWKCSFNKSKNISLKYSNESSSKTYDNFVRLYLVRLAYHTGSCSLFNLSRLLYHSDFRKTWQNNETIRNWLENKCNRPLSLENISRIVNHKYLKPNREVNISKLEIPSALKRFLRFSDV